VPARPDKPSVRDPIRAAVGPGPGSLTDNTQPEIADTEFTLETSPMADGNCQAYLLVLSRPHRVSSAGALPGRRARALVSVLHTEVAENIRITD
jgi:hypothetical protein